MSKNTDIDHVIFDVVVGSVTLKMIAEIIQMSPPMFARAIENVQNQNLNAEMENVCPCDGDVTMTTTAGMEQMRSTVKTLHAQQLTSNVHLATALLPTLNVTETGIVMTCLMNSIAHHATLMESTVQKRSLNVTIIFVLVTVIFVTVLMTALTGPMRKLNFAVSLPYILFAISPMLLVLKLLSHCRGLFV